MPETDRADEFLNAYRELEETLNAKYNVDEKKFGSPIVRFMSEKESKPYRENLDICREIRNFLSHHSEVNGERIIQPSQAMISFLGEVTDFIKQPPLAIEVSTLFADILKTTLSPGFFISVPLSAAFCFRLLVLFYHITPEEKKAPEAADMIRQIVMSFH